MIIGVVGASGFIGKELIKELKVRGYDFLSFSRTHQPKQNWRFIDLFSKSITEESLEKVDVAVYLVHSMSPSSKLTQGSFYDIDLLLADNFIRACKKNNVKKIIYVSGIIPQNGKLSKHLESRQEVEHLMIQSGIPVSVIRAGLIIGDKGSSLNILKNIVLRSPIILAPPPLYNKTQVVSVQDVVDEIIININSYPNVRNIGYDPVSFIDLIKMMQNHFNKHQKIINIPIFPVTFFSILTKFITKAPFNLIHPLFESLNVEMISNDSLGNKTEDSIKLLDVKFQKNPHAFSPTLEINKVRSIQRINLKKDLHRPVYQVFYRWLKKYIPLIGVQTKGTKLNFYLLFPSIRLLQLEYSETHSSKDRQLLFITGGLLTNKVQDYGRLEFRYINKNTIICALHDYIPAIPWWIYIFTQAYVHLLVMKQFKIFLEKP